MTDKTPEDQAVIGAAEVCRDWNAATPGLVQSWGQATENLFRAVDALRASRAPKGVRPETVGKPCMFRFTDDDPLMEPRSMWVGPNGGIGWVSMIDQFISFLPGQRIIPIQEEEGGECEHSWVPAYGDNLSRTFVSVRCTRCGAYRDGSA